jgi:diketogulonate reductase-like aldo/keto reductase
LSGERTWRKPNTAFGDTASYRISMNAPINRHVEVSGVRVPTWIYGTAWKEAETARLVRTALAAGFRAIDTANQRRHYVEAAVGEALAEALRAGAVAREEVFLQTKFTHVQGQDHRLPYDPRAPIGKQVEQSFESSLAHLGVERIDSYVLHGPSLREGLSAADWEAWRAMENLQQAGRTRLLGVSNVSAAQLGELCAKAAVRPALVQNRCFVSRGWDREVRRFCAERGMLYQAFSLLTANREWMRDARVARIAARVGRTVPQVVFRFAQQAGMIPLTGTSSAAHMAEDLRIVEFELEPDEVRTLEQLGG